MVGRVRKLASAAMAFPGNRITVVLLLLIVILTVTTTFSVAARSTDTTTDLLSELQSLRSQSNNGGLIHLNDHLLGRILAIPTPRPFSFLIFFDAKRLHSKPELSLPALKSEFSIVSKSFLENNNDDNVSDKLFFFEIEFEESQSTFALFSVNSIPNIKLVGNSAAELKTDSIQMNATEYWGSAESMAEFVESNTKLTVTPIRRPPLISKLQIMFAIAVTVIWTPFMFNKVVEGKTPFHNKNLWMIVAIVVYFLSVSGVMHNVIRKVPMYLVEGGKNNNPPGGRSLFFYRGSGMQLGAEGLAVGLLCTGMGLLLAFVSHALVHAGEDNRNSQRVVMVFVGFVSLWAVWIVISLANWKIRYRPHAYWPSSWK